MNHIMDSDRNDLGKKREGTDYDDGIKWVEKEGHVGRFKHKAGILDRIEAAYHCLCGSFVMFNGQVSIDHHGSIFIGTDRDRSGPNDIAMLHVKFNLPSRYKAASNVGLYNDEGMAIVLKKDEGAAKTE